METLFRILEIESIILSSNQQPKYMCLVCLLNWITIIQENKRQLVCFTRKWGFYLEGAWLWRISGGYSQEMMGLVLV